MRPSLTSLLGSTLDDWWARGNSGLSQGKLTLQLKEVGAGQAGVEWKENEAILEVKEQIE